MPSEILSRYDNSFAINITFLVLGLTPDKFIPPEANDDTEGSNNVVSDATSKSDLFITARIL